MRKKTGVEYEKSAFLDNFKGNDKLVNSASYCRVTFRDKAGIWKSEMRTRVFDQGEGEYKFEIIKGSRVNKNTTLDDGRMVIHDGQGDALFREAAGTVVQQQTNRDLTALDLPSRFRETAGAFPAPAASSGGARLQPAAAAPVCTQMTRTMTV